MSTLLERGLAMAARAMPAAAGGRILYQGDGDQVELAATFGRSAFQVDDGTESVRIDYSDRDFLVAAADLVLNGGLAEPKRGQKITDLATGDTYEVAAPGRERPWRYCDPFETMIRIHAKKSQKSEC